MKKITQRATSKNEIMDIIFDTEESITLTKKTLDNLSTNRIDYLTTALIKGDLVNYQKAVNDTFISTADDFDLNMANSLERQSILAVALHDFGLKYASVACLDSHVENTENKKEPFKFKNLVFDTFFKDSSGAVNTINMRAVDITKNSIDNFRLQKHKNYVDVYIFKQTDANTVKKEINDNACKLNLNALFLFVNGSQKVLMKVLKHEDSLMLTPITDLDALKKFVEKRAKYSHMIVNNNNMYTQMNYLYEKAKNDPKRLIKQGEGENGQE